MNWIVEKAEQETTSNTEMGDCTTYLQDYLNNHPDAVPADFDKMMLLATTPEEKDFYREVGDIFMSVEFKKEIRDSIY